MKNDILIVKQSDFAVDNIKNYGYSVRKPYRTNSRILNFVRNVWNQLNMPFKSVWYNKRLINVEEKYIFIIDALITSDFVKWIKNNNSNKVIIFMYLNVVKDSMNPDSIREYCKLYTWDKEDASKYNMQYYYGGYFPQEVGNVDIEYDIVYIGRDKGRLNELISLKEYFKKINIKTYFHIVGDRGWNIRKKGYTYQKNISYLELLRITRSSIAVLDLVQQGQTGMTYRVYESLFYNIKLITNNSSIVKMEFYNPNNVFILGKDDISTVKDFLQRDFVEIKDEVKQKYTFKYFVEQTRNNMEHINDSI